MSVSYRLRFLKAHRDAQEQVSAGLEIVAQGMAADVYSAQTELIRKMGAQALENGLDGPLPPDIRPILINLWDQRLRAFFLGPTGVPIEDTANGLKVYSPFLTLIWPFMLESARLGLARQRAAIENKLQNHPDLLARYMPIFDTATSVIVTEIYQSERIIPAVVAEFDNQRPIATYQPPHLWVKPDGYRLSDRIWNTNEEMRRKLDAFLADSIRNGVSAVDLSRDVERYLKAGQALTRTKKPYGRDLSYNAMRLARTEISAAYAQADIAAARANPFVTKYQPKRSRYGVPCKICDPIVDAGPYDIHDDTGVPPFHPNCMCQINTIAEEPTEDVIRRLRVELEVINPAYFNSRDALSLADIIRTDRSLPLAVTAGAVLFSLALQKQVEAPEKSNMKSDYSGEWSGDLYVVRDRWYNVTQTEFDKAAFTPMLKSSPLKGQMRGGASTRYGSITENDLLLHYQAELNIGSRQQMVKIISEAAKIARKAFEDNPILQRPSQLRMLILEQFERLSREQGIDAFVYRMNNLIVLASEKVIFQQSLVKPPE